MSEEITRFHCTECAEVFERPKKLVATMVDMWDALWDWFMLRDELRFYCPSCWRNRGKKQMMAMHERLGNRLPEQR